ncbi:unnamed protein product [Ixodes hexagonus]
MSYSKHACDATKSDVEVDESSVHLQNRTLADALPESANPSNWSPTGVVAFAAITPTPPQTRSRYKGSKLKKITETTDSETFLATIGSRQQHQYTSADTVLQLYYIDTHSASRVYANLFTCKKLSDLHTGIQNKSYGFRLIRSRILFIEDKIPDNFVKAYEEFATTRARSFHPHPDMRSKVQRYMMMESDYCGESILHARVSRRAATTT